MTLKNFCDQIIDHVLKNKLLPKEEAIPCADSLLTICQSFALTTQQDSESFVGHAALLSYAVNFIESTNNRLLQYRMNDIFSEFSNSVKLTSDYNEFISTYINYRLYYCNYIQREKFIHTLEMAIKKGIELKDSTIADTVEIAKMQHDREAFIPTEDYLNREQLLMALEMQSILLQQTADDTKNDNNNEFYTQIFLENITACKRTIDNTLTWLSDIKNYNSNENKEPNPTCKTLSTFDLLTTTGKLLADCKKDPWALNLLNLSKEPLRKTTPRKEILSFLATKLNDSLLYLRFMPENKLKCDLKLAHTNIKKLICEQRFTLGNEDKLAVPWCYSNLDEYISCELNISVKNKARDVNVLRLFAQCFIPRLISYYNSNKDDELGVSSYGIIKIANVDYHLHTVFRHYMSFDQEFFYFNVHDENQKDEQHTNDNSLKNPSYDCSLNDMTKTDDYNKNNIFHIALLAARIKGKIADFKFDEIIDLLCKLYPADAIEIKAKVEKCLIKPRTTDISFFKEQTKNRESILGLAIVNKRVSLAKELIEEVPSCKNEKNSDGKIPYDLAFDQDDPEIMDVCYTNKRDSEVLNADYKPLVAASLNSDGAHLENIRATFKGYLEEHNEFLLNLALPALFEKFPVLFAQIYKEFNNKKLTRTESSRLKEIANKTGCVPKKTKKTTLPINEDTPRRWKLQAEKKNIDNKAKPARRSWMYQQNTNPKYSLEPLWQEGSTNSRKKTIPPKFDENGEVFFDDDFLNKKHKVLISRERSSSFCGSAPRPYLKPTLEKQEATPDNGVGEIQNTAQTEEQKPLVTSDNLQPSRRRSFFGAQREKSKNSMALRKRAKTSPAKNTNALTPNNARKTRLTIGSDRPRGLSQSQPTLPRNPNTKLSIGSNRTCPNLGTTKQSKEQQKQDERQRRTPTGIQMGSQRGPKS